MKAVTFAGVRSIAVVDKPEPRIVDPRDAIVEIELAGLCGSDLHPYRGHERGIEPGTTMGHEFTGRVAEVGADVTRFRPGEAVLSPFTTSCGVCGPCRRGLSARCQRGQLFGWIEAGNGLEGGQTERVRVPLADATLLPRPEGLSATQGLLLGDVFSTGSFAVTRAGVGADAPVAVLGLGAVGLAAVLEARRAGAPMVVALDAIDERLALAEAFGAHCVPVAHADGRTRSAVEVAAEARRLAGSEGIAVVVDAAGSPGATEAGLAMLRPGGVLSVVGVHTEPAFALSPVAAYDANLTLMTGRCPVRSRIEPLIAAQLADPLPIERIATHRAALDDAPDAYRQFDERRGGCIKLLFEP